MGDKEKKFSKNKDCGCGSPKCDCGDNCNCTPEDNCGCNCCNNPQDKDCGCGHKDCHCGDNCNCTTEHNCGCDCNHEEHECNCGDDCHCHNGGECNCNHDDCHCHDEDHEHCHCHHEPSKEDYQKLFAELQYALIEGEKQLQKARNEATDNARIAASYKKDLERYKERNANIETDAQNSAVENVAAKLVPVLDQFETALAATANTAERKGFEMIYAGLKRAVTDLGVAEIDALNQEFDSNYHNAVNRAATKDKTKDGKVTAVYQKGYYLTKTNKIIRYAMVEIGEYVK